MKKLAAIAAAALLATACASTAKYEGILESWLGAPAENLVNSWGPPTQVQVLGEDTFYIYQHSAQGTYTIPGQAPTYTTTCNYGTCTTTPSGGRTAQTHSYHHHCKTTFTIRSDIIVSWRYYGNSCKI